MDPNQTCEMLLQHLKNSNLNYNLSESPFSVTIHLKKSFIKDKNGIPRSSGIPDQSMLHSQTKPANQNNSTANMQQNIDIPSKQSSNLPIAKQQTCPTTFIQQTNPTSWPQIYSTSTVQIPNLTSSQLQSDYTPKQHLNHTNFQQQINSTPTVQLPVPNLATTKLQFKSSPTVQHPNITTFEKQINSTPIVQLGNLTTNQLQFNPTRIVHNTNLSTSQQQFNCTPIVQLHNLTTSQLQVNSKVKQPDLTTPKLKRKSIPTVQQPNLTDTKNNNNIMTVSTPSDQATRTSEFSPRKLPRSPSPTPRTPPGRPPGYPKTPDPTSPPDPLPFPPGSPPPGVFGWTAEYLGMTSDEFENFVEVMNK